MLSTMIVIIFTDYFQKILDTLSVGLHDSNSFEFDSVNSNTLSVCLDAFKYDNQGDSSSSSSDDEYAGPIDVEE